jgi:hypothetical protein
VQLAGNEAGADFYEVSDDEFERLMQTGCLQSASGGASAGALTDAAGSYCVSDAEFEKLVDAGAAHQVGYSFSATTASIAASSRLFDLVSSQVGQSAYSQAPQSSANGMAQQEDVFQVLEQSGLPDSHAAAAEASMYGLVHQPWASQQPGRSLYGLGVQSAPYSMPQPQDAYT